MIVKNINSYNLISYDNLENSFVQASEDYFMRKNSNDNVINLFIPTMQIYYYLVQSNYYENDLGYVIDLSKYNEELFELFSKNSIVIFLGYSNLTKEELFNNIRKYDKENEWTYIESDYMLEKLCDGFINRSKKYEKYALKHNCWYVDVSKNREQVLNKVFNKIKKMIA